MNVLPKLAVLGVVFALPFVTSARAQAQEPTFVLTESLTLAPGPVGPGVTAVTSVGNPGEAGSMYALYVKYAAGAKSVPHTHRDQRIMTVISGTFYAGTGPVFDESKVKALKPGSLAVIPGNAVHWGWAKDGDVILQEVGVGPTSTVLLPATATK
jgi:quercetin dioxygenase-like cupin family protein